MIIHWNFKKNFKFHVSNCYSRELFQKNGRNIFEFNFQTSRNALYLIRVVSEMNISSTGDVRDKSVKSVPVSRYFQKNAIARARPLSTERDGEREKGRVSEREPKREAYVVRSNINLIT
ncbi:hypothetical protein PUN28_002547 [Cardiocondyla obscurior]|uniref:Uncharacterized protein n=1 Tax=Cardiocondyla obscurior TaxID=286306 RepID=A0AAW2GV26_9HYME